MTTRAVAYYRTSSAANVDGDSEERQRVAVFGYASRNDLAVTEEFYDAAVSGADAVMDRPGFSKLLQYCTDEGISVILVENASRFARDLMVQMTGYELLKKAGIDLIPVDAPTHFTDPTPTGELVRQILAAISQFEKAGVVSKLKAARDRKRAKTGRCEGRPPAPAAARAQALELRRREPHLSLRQISRRLYDLGHRSPSGQSYSASSIQSMLKGEKS